MEQLKIIVNRLRKPSVALSLVSQVVAICMLFGFNVNENHVMTIATSLCALLATAGIMSNPDTQKKGFGDDLLVCSNSGNVEPHVMINGQMVCTGCGAVYGGENTEIEPEEKDGEEP